MTLVLTLAGRPWTLDVDRWYAPATDAERRVLSGLDGPVLDIGCGPGRLIVALAELGIPALGIDTSTNAVRHARRSGACVLQRSVFQALPAEGRWRTALLLDGNIGIGGDPTALLRRTTSLLADDGCALVEVEPPGHPSTTGPAILHQDGRPMTDLFPWSRVAADDLSHHASAAGLAVQRRVAVDGRHMAVLTRG